jgi:large subunit ribosomal protein L25
MATAASLKVEKRPQVGKGQSRSLRREGKTPAIIYGDKKKPVAIAINTQDLNVELRKPGFHTRLYDLKLEEETVRVLPQDIALHPVNDNAEHIDFLRVNENTKVTIDIPVSFINEESSPGLKRGGILNVTRYNVEVVCPVANIPEKFEFDLTDLEIGDSIHFSDTQIDESVAPTITDRDFTIASIAAPSIITETEEAEETDEEVEGEEATDSETETEETTAEKKEDKTEDKKEES